MNILSYKMDMSFLVFEGIDAVGKSSLLNSLCNKLKDRKLPFVKTKEPGGTKSGEKIRNILLDKENTTLDFLAETLLYYADRRQHIEELIKPSLKKALWVLSDRYWASTAAYQCGGRKLDESFVNSLREKICKDCEPDLWILLDLPAEEALKRILNSRKGERDRLESEGLAFQNRVRDYYLKLSQKNPSQWLVLDASKAPEVLLEELLSTLKQKKLLEI